MPTQPSAAARSGLDAAEGWGPAGGKRPSGHLLGTLPCGLRPPERILTDFSAAGLPGCRTSCLCQYYDCPWISCGQGRKFMAVKASHLEGIPLPG